MILLKNQILSGIMALLLLPCISTARADERVEASPDPGPGLVYIIPIEGMIEPALTYVIRRGVIEAEKAGADALVLEMDTPGGAVKATEEIISILNRVELPTYTLVKHNAISAGAIIALSTDTIYMQPGSKIGDAMPVMASPTGGMQPLPDAEREKITSYVDTIIRATAEQNGHNVEIASAMVRREQEVIIDDVVISKEGQLLTMTNLEAERRFGEDQVPLLSTGTVKDREAFLDEIGFPNAVVKKLEVTELERLARFIAAMAPFFMMGGMLGLYLEFKTPGFGIFGILGIVCLVIFFFGHKIAGLSGNEDVVLLVVGIVLLGIEIFALPGFGFLGLTGLALIMIAMLNAMIEKLPSDPIIPPFERVQLPFQNFGLSLLLTFGAAAVLARFLPRTSMFHKLVLQQATATDAGYSASASRDDLIGLTGKSLSDLHPSGPVRLNGRKVDVITHGEFIPQNEKVKVVEVHGSRVIVEKVKPGETAS